VKLHNLQQPAFHMLLQVWSVRKTYSGDNPLY